MRGSGCSKSWDALVISGEGEGVGAVTEHMERLWGHPAKFCFLTCVLTNYTCVAVCVCVLFYNLKKSLKTNCLSLDRCVLHFMSFPEP